MELMEPDSIFWDENMVKLVGLLPYAIPSLPGHLKADDIHSHHLPGTSQDLPLNEILWWLQPLQRGREQP